MSSLLLSFAVSTVLGYAIVSIFWPPRLRTRATLLLRICLGAGLGLGATACVSFACFVLVGSAGTIMPLVEGVLTLLLVGFYVIRLPRGRSDEHAPVPAGPSRSKVTWLAFAVFMAMLLVGAASLVAITCLKPHGDWDAFATWNNRARFLFRGCDPWQQAFSAVIPRAVGNYPPLLPLVVNRAWTYTQSDSVAGPICVAVLFTLGTVALTVCALHLLRGPTQAFLAGAALLGTPYLISHGASQYADVPFAFFVLSALVLITLHARFRPESHSLLVLAGLATGRATVAKNEGAALVICLGAVGAFACLRTRPWTTGLKQAGSFAAGLAVPFGMLIYFKLYVGVGGGQLSGVTAHDAMTRLCDLSRYRDIAVEFLGQIIGIRTWGVLLIVLPVYRLLVGRGTADSDRGVVRFSIVVLLLVLATYWAMYLVSPLNLAWLLSTSSSRLILQLWPSAVFVLFLAARTPEEALSRERADRRPATRLT